MLMMKELRDLWEGNLCLGNRGSLINSRLASKNLCLGFFVIDLMAWPL